MGAGDVKLMAATGTLVGPALVLKAFLFTAVAGGVLIKDGQGAILGSVGVSGDTSDNDEIAAAAGIEAAGLVFDTGA